MESVCVDWRVLQKFTSEVFEKLGMAPEDAALEAEVLVWANLSGIDSHGVLRIPWYVELVERALMNPKPNIRILRETPSVLMVEGDRAFGPVVTVFAMDKVITKAKKTGIGWAVLRNITHQGALGYYTLMATRRNAVGIAIVCSPPNMAPFGARAPGVHNSPISIAAPAKQHPPLVLDMATSIAAGGKIRLARDKGSPIPQGWALDKNGEPTTDPNLASILLPFGGPKGSGLAMMFECLTGIMAGNPLQEPILSGKKKQREHNQNGVVAAIDIGTFTDLEIYRQTVDGYIEGVKSLPRTEGFSEILVPGELERITYEKRLKNGIPLPRGTVENLKETARKLNVALPEWLRDN
ncbi:MAG: Ldh family oxidoreductase [Deltaproteobacteria bacterium]|nr:Ldh family oxidoreductase [Deltaproteobacteria bacterium]MBW1960366.1 Ldh family oxidoreductase [Deltaproteobacteria bacterium]MBW1993053.1 Ldh family oxidoreductase [Deltaproteobacteria bacterium]MBW2151624.1 Ldh family oxidoreductase [Deltaproteobacteria bacterium]